VPVRDYIHFYGDVSNFVSGSLENAFIVDHKKCSKFIDGLNWKEEWVTNGPIYYMMLYIASVSSILKQTIEKV
jgi:hypothetical protein